MIYDVLLGETIVENQEPRNVTDKVGSSTVSPDTPIGSLTPVYRSWVLSRPYYALGLNRILFGCSKRQSFQFIVSSSHGTKLISLPTYIFTGLDEPYLYINHEPKTLTYKYYIDKDNEYKVGIIINDNGEIVKPTNLTNRANAIISDPSNCVFECIINPDKLPLLNNSIEWYIGKTSQEVKYGFNSIQSIATDSYLIDFTVDYTGDTASAIRTTTSSYVYVNKGTETFPILIQTLYDITALVNYNSNNRIYQYINNDVSSRIDTLEEQIGPISAKINGANSLFVSR